MVRDYNGGVIYDCPLCGFTSAFLSGIGEQTGLGSQVCLKKRETSFRYLESIPIG